FVGCVDLEDGKGSRVGGRERLDLGAVAPVEGEDPVARFDQLLGHFEAETAVGPSNDDLVTHLTILQPVARGGNWSQGSQAAAEREHSSGLPQAQPMARRS